MTTGGKVRVLSWVLMLMDTWVVVSSRVCVGPGTEISTVLSTVCTIVWGTVCVRVRVVKISLT